MATSAPTKIESVVYAYQTEHGNWRVTGSRVSIDSIIHAYQQGESPEQIAQNFPALSAEQVHGAIAFYLHHRDMMDRYLKEQAELHERLRAEAAERNRDLHERIEARATRLGSDKSSE